MHRAMGLEEARHSAMASHTERKMAVAAGLHTVQSIVVEERLAESGSRS